MHAVITVIDAEGNQMPGATYHGGGRLINTVKTTLYRAGSLNRALEKGPITITIQPRRFGHIGEKEEHELQTMGIPGHIIHDPHISLKGIIEGFKQKRGLTPESPDFTNLVISAYVLLLLTSKFKIDHDQAAQIAFNVAMVPSNRKKTLNTT